MTTVGANDDKTEGIIFPYTFNRMKFNLCFVAKVLIPYNSPKYNFSNSFIFYKILYFGQKTLKFHFVLKTSSERQIKILII